MQIPNVANSEISQFLGEWADHCEDLHPEFVWQDNIPAVVSGKRKHAILCKLCQSWFRTCEISSSKTEEAKSLALSAVTSGNTYASMCKMWQGEGRNTAPVCRDTFALGKQKVCSKICEYTEESMKEVLNDALAAQKRGDEIVISIDGL
jgi:hypothetical protein